MREILFRGKRKSGPWCYGDLLNYDDVYKTIINKEDECIVIPETIGQYTGLKDKNGKMIFEMDVIEKEMSDGPYSSKRKFCKVRSVVVWDSGFNVQNNDHNNKCLYEDMSVFNCEPRFTGKEITNEKGLHYHDWSIFSQCEVVGNIHDNPELLK